MVIAQSTHVITSMSIVSVALYLIWIALVWSGRANLHMLQRKKTYAIQCQSRKITMTDRKLGGNRDAGYATRQNEWVGRLVFRKRFRSTFSRL